ncbi:MULTISPECIES: heterocyst-inhibiting protein PatX [Trichocoleus]|uniref:Secreted protein n=1 Tax=Trichocoleus desertorum GB2-A4 TaxID=2933944 RepID=A0ABV0JAE7_9CYAN|nr:MULTISPECIES: hypothetical protein [unclassified Trichocoleus]MBD1861475.1 hypothetical protein [Trichocoleus sp. FACHB-46]MBD2096933.1 hypothetical protein [Trichocoleus sp. FACHB-591]MBD2122137.1 hypothetical protein [Trichocoleus sp. FACHB-262]
MHIYQSVIAVQLLTVVLAFGWQPTSYSLHNSPPSAQTQATLAAQASRSTDVAPHRGSGRRSLGQIARSFQPQI